MTEFKDEAPWDWKGASIIFLLMLIMNFLILSTIQSTMLSVTGWTFDSTGQVVTTGAIYGIWVGTIITEFIILGITIFAAFYIYQGKFPHFNFRLPSLKHLLIAIGGAFAAYFLSLLGGILQDFVTGPDPNQATYDALFKTSNVFELIVWMLIMMFVVAVCEEIFARGFVQKGFHNSCRAKRLPIIIGILTPSLLFAVLHLDIYRFIPLLLVGIVLGLVYYFTNDNSLASTITHGLYNSIGILIYFLFP